MATVSSSSLCSIVIVFPDGRERVQVRSTPRWAAAPYVKAFNSHGAAQAEIREPVLANAKIGGAA